MRSPSFEFILKGVFLGLWAAVAFRQSPAAPNTSELWNHFFWTLTGLGVGCVFAAGELILRGHRPWRNPLAFLVLVLLEGSYWIYLGIVGGLAASLIRSQLATPELPEGGRNWLGYCVIAGAVLGYGLMQLRGVRDWRWRFSLAALVGIGLVVVAVMYLDESGWLQNPEARRAFGLFILAGLPFFYLLGFCGVTEESEVEIAALCAGLGVGIHLLQFPANVPSLGFLLPVGLYVIYITKWITGLRGFKHTLRGYNFLLANQFKPALLSFRRARQIDSKNALAAQGLLQVHRKLDPIQLESDPELSTLLDFGFCLDRAESLLVGERTPTTAERTEAGKLIDLTQRYRPALSPRISYLRAILATHEKQFDEAAGHLKTLLDPANQAEARQRDPFVFAAWDLALRLHPELIKRLGEAELSAPGRRMDAIAAIERQLVRFPNDSTAQELKTVFYAGLTESEYLAASPRREFSFDYVEQLGLALVDDANPGRRDRGMAFLRIAARGLADRGPALFQKLATAAEASGDREAAAGYRGQIKRVGLEIGPQSLPADQRTIFFETVQRLVTDAVARNDFESAAADQRLLIGSGPNELEQYRTLADYYEKAGDPLNALVAVETARLYKSNDADLLTRKDKYYYSVTPERLAAVKDKVESLFDVEYCVNKANSVLSSRDADLDLLDWADHLISLARIMKPRSLPAMLAQGRLKLRRGDRDTGLSLLEDVREANPTGGDDKEAWYMASRILGELYLNELNRPDLAVTCFTDYKEHPKSGADTLFWIAKSHENLGDVKNAIRFYDAVTAYDQHPRYWEATEAVSRLKNR